MTTSLPLPTVRDLSEPSMAPPTSLPFESPKRLMLFSGRANPELANRIAGKLGLDAERVIVTVDRHANTSAASIPLALSVAAHDGRIRRGDLVLFEALGGGMTWGANLVRW